MSRRLRLATTALGAVVGLVLLLAPVGAAASTRVLDDGWWWRVQTGVGGRPLPPPPGVGEDDLLVQAQPEGATAIAAVSAVLADGQASPVLTLKVASDQGGEAAIVLACQAGSAWTGVHAGNWEAKPTADCESGQVEGERAEDGTTWTFDLTSLQFNDKLNFVLVPGTTEGGATPPFSLAFEAPTAADIATSSGTAPPAVTPTTAGSFSPPPSDGSFSDPGAPPSDDFTPPDIGAEAPPTDPAPAPALEPEDQGATQTSPQQNEATAPPLPEIDGETSRVAARAGGVLVLLLALAAAALLLRSPAAAALVTPAATAEAPVEGGLSRFRRERTSDPTPVS